VVGDAIVCHCLVLLLLGITIAWQWLDIHVALCCSCFVLLLLGGVGGAFAIAISIAAVASLSSIENIIPGTWYHVWYLVPGIIVPVSVLIFHLLPD